MPHLGPRGGGGGGGRGLFELTREYGSSGQEKEKEFGALYLLNFSYFILFFPRCPSQQGKKI